jgi:hypothetical protein
MICGYDFTPTVSNVRLGNGECIAVQQKLPSLGATTAVHAWMFTPSGGD